MIFGVPHTESAPGKREPHLEIAAGKQQLSMPS
jgi:hypothetical protein